MTAHLPPHDDATDAAPPVDLRGRTILQVLPALGTGGAERGCVDVAAAIEAAGGKALVASAGGAMLRDLARTGAEHVALPLAGKNPLTIWRNIRRLEAVIRDRGVDLVHARSRAPAWSAHAACRRQGIPFVTTVHAPYNQHNAAKRLYNSIMGRGDRVIAISDYVARYIVDSYGTDPARIRTIPRGVDLRQFAIEAVSAERMIKLARAWRAPDDRPVVLMPGRLSRWKGQTVVIDALARLGRHDLCCLIVGSDQGRSGYRQELIDRIAAKGLNGVVQLVDHCDDMPAAYMLSDVVVHASTDPEGFGRVVVEAMALGRPVIATNIGAPPEVVAEGETGWLVPPGDPDALAAVIDHALSLTPEERGWMADRAIATVAAHYTKEAMTGSTLAVYRELLGDLAVAG
ncbi:glycosyltransferase family 4 protein [Inquilinus sp. OTU3971]|uniref:glycosyltransferase family 4 protein n=1 Tax=Inquilinus sp. OTU3971 TaxID=3043855 RepID=UPI00313D14FC